MIIAASEITMRLVWSKHRSLQRGERASLRGVILFGWMVTTCATLGERDLCACRWTCLGLFLQCVRVGASSGEMSGQGWSWKHALEGIVLGFFSLDEDNGLPVDYTNDS